MRSLFSTDGWTKSSMPDQSGKTVLVTGANSGLGYEATKAFAEKGAHVVMACRSTDRGESARESIREAFPAASLSVRELDLADLDSIRSFAEEFTAAYDSLDVLCNNAGVMAIPRRETDDGFEMQFGVNHLSHFALTGRLLGLLRSTSGESRIVTHSSGVHERGRIDFDDLQHEQSYDKWEAYAQSKLANLLFAYELDRRLDDEGDVVSTACHPGYAATNLQKRGPEMAGSRLRLAMMKVANAVLAQSAQAGALPMLYAATHSEITGGEYVGPGGFANMRGTPELQESSDRSYDESSAQRLWTVSEELTGVEYDL
ncbi:SDR family NAD(P)-dependent oxidoreductase [Halovenus sp. WSH3]|uniref:SDR family NAD(P)-dependent oxidoreductase n=1 Tax=Halovenus carboxidivorans TaxID=2692199 RepID=A0A6B0TBP8_9EURY|nr:oxidoreductase [Halovenus carboxidivorans]MXR53063.1 SDR family NAD(P)-dependent oxidoreductase [Halovenus carboxidivorans]